MQAASATQALAHLNEQDTDLILLDIHMPGTNGLALAQQIKHHPRRPAVIFVTADEQHALAAFELAAYDYLTKPVRRERLYEALQRVVQRVVQRSDPPLANPGHEPLQADNRALIVQHRGDRLRVPIQEVTYFKADQKYVSVRTEKGNYLIEESLNWLQERWGEDFVRIHRNALVAKHLVAGLHRSAQDTWVLSLHGAPERLEVSRRHVSEVRQLLFKS